MQKNSQIGEYKIDKTIGRGAFSKVKLGYKIDTGEKVAIKIINKKLIRESRNKNVSDKKKTRAIFGTAEADEKGLVAKLEVTNFNFRRR
jgi:serine/threonine protein kinase